MKTKKEVLLMSRTADLGCIVCKLFYNTYSPALIHHATGLKYRCTGKKAKEFIGLCHAHHDAGSPEHPSIHRYPKEFNDKYGSQSFLYDYTQKFLGGD